MPDKYWRIVGNPETIHKQRSGTCRSNFLQLDFWTAGIFQLARHPYLLKIVPQAQYLFPPNDFFVKETAPRTPESSLLWECEKQCRITPERYFRS